MNGKWFCSSICLRVWGLHGGNCSQAGPEPSLCLIGGLLSLGSARLLFIFIVWAVVGFSTPTSIYFQFWLLRGNPDMSGPCILWCLSPGQLPLFSCPGCGTIQRLTLEDRRRRQLGQVSAKACPRAGGSAAWDGELLLQGVKVF